MHTRLTPARSVNSTNHNEDRWGLGLALSSRKKPIGSTSATDRWLARESRGWRTKNGLNCVAV